MINDKCAQFIVSIIEPYTLDTAKWRALINIHNNHKN